MNFFFRTNFNEKVGLGHLFRCLRLIRYFETQKHSCYLFTDVLKKKYYFLKNFKVIPIYKKKVHFFDQKKDVIQFKKVTKNFKKGIVVIDDYRIGVDWEKCVSKFHKKVGNKKLNIYHRKNKHQVFQGTEKNALNIAFGCTNRTLSFYFPRGLP